MKDSLRGQGLLDQSLNAFPFPLRVQQRSRSSSEDTFRYIADSIGLLQSSETFRCVDVVSRNDE